MLRGHAHGIGAHILSLRGSFFDFGGDVFYFLRPRAVGWYLRHGFWLPTKKKAPICMRFEMKVGLGAKFLRGVCGDRAGYSRLCVRGPTRHEFNCLLASSGMYVFHQMGD